MSGPEKLVYMANQIANFFVAQPGDKAALQIADHLNAFWDPSMRRAIVAHLDAGGEGLLPSALEAVRMIKERPPKVVERALDKTSDASPARAPGSDAG